MTSDKFVLVQILGKETGAESASVCHGSALPEPVPPEPVPPGSTLFLRGDPPSGGEAASSAVRLMPAGSPPSRPPMLPDATHAVSRFQDHKRWTLARGAERESGWVAAVDVPVWCGGLQRRIAGDGTSSPLFGGLTDSLKQLINAGSSSALSVLLCSYPVRHLLRRWLEPVVFRLAVIALVAIPLKFPLCPAGVVR